MSVAISSKTRRGGNLIAKIKIGEEEQKEEQGMELKGKAE
jgi:hypothetical protein